MSAPRDGMTPVADAAVLHTIQQFNQSRIVGKLLHDLRNPLHSLRIAIELFNRIAREGAGASKLLEKAGRYAAPADNAVTALAAQVEWMALFVSAPRAPAIEPLALDPWLNEIAHLLRESTHGIDAAAPAPASDAVALADGPRLSHAVVHWALTRLQTCSLQAAAHDGTVELRVGGVTAERVAEGAASDSDLKSLIEQAGASVAMLDGELIILLKRGSAPS